jgi:hypothetical protein
MGLTNKHITDAGRAKSAVMFEHATGATANSQMFYATATLTSGTVAGVTASLLSDAVLESGQQVFLMGATAIIGGTSWTAAKNIDIQDTAGNSVCATNAAGTNAMTSGAVFNFGGGSVANIAFVPTTLSYGSTANKGLILSSSASVTTMSATVAVWGMIK